MRRCVLCAFRRAAHVCLAPSKHCNACSRLHLRSQTALVRLGGYCGTGLLPKSSGRRGPKSAGHALLAKAQQLVAHLDGVGADMQHAQAATAEVAPRMERLARATRHLARAQLAVVRSPRRLGRHGCERLVGAAWRGVRIGGRVVARQQRFISCRATASAVARALEQHAVKREVHAGRRVHVNLSRRDFLVWPG